MSRMEGVADLHQAGSSRRLSATWDSRAEEDSESEEPPEKKLGWDPHPDCHANNVDTQEPSCSNLVNLQTNDNNPHNDSRPVSGLRTSYHGVAYQVHWNMVVAIEAKERWKKNEEAKSAFTFKTTNFETEDPDAGKSDDVVWKYEIGSNVRASEDRFEYNFLQAKNRLNRNEKIFFNDLVKPKQQEVEKQKGVDKRPFALEKYFISYKNEIKRGKKYEDGKVANLIIATNIDLNDDLKNDLFSEVKEEYIPVLDLMKQVTKKKIDVWGIGKRKGSHYNTVREKLLSTYDSIKLVNELANCLLDHKSLSKGSFISSYLFDLMQNDIIDKSGKFSSEFLENKQELSQEATNFRALLKVTFKNKKSKVDGDFKIPNPKSIAELIASKIKHASDFEVKIARLKPQRKVIDENLDKLANFVLVRDNENKTRFSNVFWTKDQLRGNLEEFRRELKQELERLKIIKSNDSILVIANDLKKYKFNITGENKDKKKFQTCNEILIDEESFLKSFKINIDISELKLIKLAIGKSRLLELNIVHDNGKFSDDFVNGNDNLPIEGQEFRSFLLKEGFDDKRTSLSNDFRISEPANFAEEIASLINKSANSNNMIQIIRKKPIIIANINKLANYVFVKNNKSDVKFSFTFWEEKDIELQGNLKEFRNQLKRQLGHYSIIDEQSTGTQIAEALQKYSFRVANFNTCSECLVDKKAFLKTLEKGNIYENIRAVLPFNTKLPAESLEEMLRDVDEFFSKLRFVVNCSQNDLDDFIKIKCIDFTGFVNDFVAHKFQVMISNALNLASDDFISDVQQVNKFFNEANEQLDSLTLTGLTENYRAKLELYDIEFGSNFIEDLLNLKLDNASKHFIDSDKQVFSIFTEQKDLTYMKLFKALDARPEYRNRDSYASLPLNSAIRLLNCVTRAFKSETKNLLVINCGTMDKNIDSVLFLKLSDVLKSTERKKIIFISQKNKDLASKFRSSFPGKYEEKEDDQIGLINLADQKKCLNNRTLIFQGKKTKLNELLSNAESNLVTEFCKLINGEVLFDIIDGKEIRIGSRLPSISDRNSPAYFKVMEVLDESNERHLKNDDLFVVSGIDKDTLTTRLILEEDQIVAASKDSIFPPEKSSQYVVLDTKSNNESVNVFESLCRQYQESLSMGRIEAQEERLIHLIEFHDENFIWNRYYDPKFYIDRSFNKILLNEKFKTDYLKEMPVKSIFLVGKIPKDEFAKQFGIDEENIASTLDDPAVNKPILILSRGDEEEKAQQILKELPPKCTFHWIQSEDDNFIWKRSSAEIETLSCFRSIGYSPEDCDVICDREPDCGNTIEESELVGIIKNERLLVCADIPGMGKSTTLLSLSRSYKKLYPLDWVIKLNLRDCESTMDANLRDLSTGNNGDAIDATVKFLSEIDPEGFEHPLAKELLRLKLSSNLDSGILLLLDGFDEMRGNKEVGQKHICDLLDFLKRSTQVKIVITTRPYAQERTLLEKSLSVLSYNFSPIADHQGRKYIERVWQNSLKLVCNQNESNISHLRKFIKILYDKRREVFAERLSSFVGVPLQLQMFAETFLKKLTEFEKNENIRNETSMENLLKDVNVFWLYTEFISRKYDIYFQEKKRYGEIVTGSHKEILKKTYEQKHKSLAFEYIVGKSSESTNSFCALFMSNKKSDLSSIVKELNEVGILHSQENNRIDFVHRTFAEYYVSELIFERFQEKALNPDYTEEAKKKIWEFLLHHVFLHDDYNVIRIFINCKLSSQHLILDFETHYSKFKNIVHDVLDRAVPGGEIFIVETAVNAYTKQVLTPLEVVAMEGLSEIVEFMLKIAKSSYIMDTHFPRIPKNSVRRDLGYIVLTRTAWQRALEYSRVNVIKVLLKYAKKIDECQCFLDFQYHRIKTRTINSPLHMAVLKSSFEMVQCLVESGASIQSKVVHFEETLNVEKDLIRVLFTPLHCAFVALVYHPINPRNRTDRLKKLQYLLDKGSDVNAKDAGDNTPLHLACVGGHERTILHIVRPRGTGDYALSFSKVKIFMGLLRIPNECHSLEIVEEMIHLLVEHVFSRDGGTSVSNLINAKNMQGFTPIFLAASCGLWKLVSYLMSKVDHIQIHDNVHGATTLHILAAEAEEDSMIKMMEDFVSKSRIDVNVQTKVLKENIWSRLSRNDDTFVGGETPLHWAVENNNPKAVEVLLRFGADASVVNAKDQTALDLCQNSSIFQLLTGGSIAVHSDVSSELDSVNCRSSE